MIAIGRFLQSKDHRSMSIAGMMSTGKTRLLVEAIDAIERQGRKAIPLAPNSRLAHIATVAQDIQCASVYRYLYLNTDGSDSTERPRSGAASEYQVDSPKAKTPEDKSRKKSGTAKAIPLRECADPDDCVYLVDDAHLLSDNPFVTPDGKKYGSGRLLTDLFAFGNFAQSSRQVIFFADPYQIQRAAPTDSVVDGSFQPRHGLGHVTLPLEQLIDVSHGGALLRNAVSLVNAMRTENFASLSMAEDENVRITDGETAAQELVERFRSDPFSVWYLADTHAKIAKFVRWLRSKLFDGRRLAALEQGDLLEVASIRPPRDLHVGDARRVHAGERYSVDEIGIGREILQPLKGRQEPAAFRMFEYVALKGPDILALEHSGSLGWFLEDYLTEERPELPVDTAIAVRAWVNSQKTEGRGGIPQPDDDGSDTVEADEEVGLSGVSLARYGYGATVHHAQGMSQPLCYLNADHAAGRHSDAYFRWLYTALTTAGRTLTLFNFTPIHPFDSIDWNTRAAEQAVDIPVGAGWQFSPATTIAPSDEQRAPDGLAASKNLPNSIAIWLCVANAMEDTAWRISKVVCAPYREKYELRGPGGSVRLSVAYDGKCVVKALHIDGEAHWPLLCDVAECCIASNKYSDGARSLLDSTHTLTSPAGWKLVSAAESNWRLSIALVRNPDERLWLEINFDKEGLATTVRPLKFSEPALLEEIRGLLQ
jgi:hypothetical protein